ncbi:MAG: hypothetical protein LAQ30_10545 [Acidobacteriia bacterium]|nr:hypothetical protein [Terriglobia bacterium]
MTLQLTREEVEELRKALAAAHGDALRELSTVAGCGVSAKGIDGCRRRSRIERLLRTLDGIGDPVSLPAAGKATRRIALAA